MSAKVRIAITPTSLGTRVWLDDVEITDIVSLVVSAAAGDVSRLTLTFVAREITIDGEVRHVAREESWRWRA